MRIIYNIADLKGLFVHLSVTRFICKDYSGDAGITVTAVMSIRAGEGDE